VPALHGRGVALQGWMVWGVMALMIAVCISPDLYQKYRNRERKQ
jgi:hypothetical protein